MMSGPTNASSRNDVSAFPFVAGYSCVQLTRSPGLKPWVLGYAVVRSGSFDSGSLNSRVLGGRAATAGHAATPSRRVPARREGSNIIVVGP